MVFFNYSTMQMHAKVVYYGPGLCGKTTNLQYIYDHTGNDSRGEMVSLATETDRTLFFDLLPIDVGKIAGFTTRIQLYTVPGQVFYNTTRKLVLKGVDGVVFVADSQRPMVNANVESFENLEENLAEMGLDLVTIPVVLQYNKRDLPNILTVQELDESLNKGGWPSVEASALNGDGVFETLKTISKATLIALKNRMTKGRSDSAAKPKPAPAPNRPLPAAPPPRKAATPMPSAPPAKAAQPAAAPEREPSAVKAAVAEPVAAAAAVTDEAVADDLVLEDTAADNLADAEPTLESVEIDPDVAAAAGLKTTGSGYGMDPASGEASPAGAGDDELEPVEIEAPPDLEPVDFDAIEADDEAVEEDAELFDDEEDAPTTMVATVSEPAPEAPAPRPVAAPAQPQPAPAAPAKVQPGPVAAKPAAAPSAKPRKRSGGVDVLAELEMLRRQALDPRAAARAARANGRQEVRRDVDLALRGALTSARRFSLTVQVEDEHHRELLDQAHRLTVDIDRPGDIEQLLLRLHIALRSAAR